MPTLLWDASALVKRYAVEAGSPSVAALFDLMLPSQMVATFWGYVETLASLLRKNSPTPVLVAADTRLLRAADAEGLTTLNPETVSAVDIPPLLSAW